MQEWIHDPIITNYKTHHDRVEKENVGFNFEEVYNLSAETKHNCIKYLVNI